MLGYGASNDAHHMAQPDPESIGVAEMMRAALERAGIAPERVGYINAHGTSTPLGDAAETKAIKDVFGDHAYKLAVSSTKSMTGHCFGAAGAIEAMMCVLAVHEGVIPPTINYRDPDPDVRPRLRAERGARGAGRRRPLERDGPRRPQRLRPPRAGRMMASSSTRSRGVRRGAHDPDGELFERLAAETREKTTAPQMMVGAARRPRSSACSSRAPYAPCPRARHVHRLLVDLHGARRCRPAGA